MMENRYSVRSPVALDVELHHGRTSFGTFKVRNISLEGMFVETGPMHLYPSDLIDATLTVGLKPTATHEIRAVVVHHSDEGIGLIFRDYEPAFLGFLRFLSSVAA
ncbi:MAG: PilZ domain-containing protein [Gammaproteobacteria bacterium]